MKFAHLCSRFSMFTLVIVSLLQNLQAAETIKVGDQAKDFSLETIDGHQVSLSKLHKDGPAVVVVLRGYPGYQCPLCSRQVAELLKNAREFEKAQANVILIYPGPADNLTTRAREFIGKSKLPAHFSLVTDPGYNFTNDWFLRWNAVRETAYPSVFVVGRDGKVTFVHVSNGHGNRASTKSVLDALDQ